MTETTAVFCPKRWLTNKMDQEESHWEPVLTKVFGMPGRMREVHVQGS